jgi:general secretion pathway protein E/type IV pilus assembly protein PilB
MFKNEDYVVNLLVQEGLVSQGQIQKAHEYSKIVKKPVVDALCDMGFATRRQVLELLANQLQIEIVNLQSEKVSKEALALLDFNSARRYKALPLKIEDTGVTVALSDPFDLESLDNLQYLFKKNVTHVLADPEDLEKALNKYYGVAEAAVDEMLHELSDTDLNLLEKDGGADEVAEDSEAPIIKLVSLLMLEAFKNRASDIHLEPLERKFRVRFRIDGVLQEIQGPPKRLQPSVISRIKIMSNMSIAERRLPQDGRIKLNLFGKAIDLRVSVIPTAHGESIVLRLLDKSNLLLGLGQLGFLSDDEKKFENLIRNPNGILLITGPTGSGKTTTLYACLNFLNHPDRKLITVEDPVEYQLAGINQVQVNETIGLNFANVLRSILRQAPNIIMIGEIRDFETAEIAVHAALTGHLVFSTLHTNDAPGAITRLIDQGVKPFLVASSLIGILAQRLIRTICQKCKEPVEPAEAQLKHMRIPLEKLKGATFYKGKGCEHCNGVGYRGRIGIMELLEVEDSIRKLIYQKASSPQIRKRARELGMRTLREDGFHKVLAGITTLEEIYRTTVDDVD